MMKSDMTRTSARVCASLVVIVLLLVAAPLPPRAAGAATPTPVPRATTPVPLASPTPAPSQRGATPQTPVPDTPGELAGVRYDPAKDEVGAGHKVLGYRDAQLRNGVPQADANRIALAHYKYDCAQTGNCDQTGLDLSGVDVYDAHANFGYHPECQVWGVDFKPWWGVWSPPENQPSCAGAGSGGASTGGGGFGLDPGALAARVLAALDWKALLTALLQGAWAVLVGDGVERIGGELGALLLLTPDLRRVEAQQGNIQGLVDALRTGMVGACTVAFVVTIGQFVLGQEGDPRGPLARLGAVLFALGFYRQLVGWVVEAAAVITAGVYTAGADTTTATFPAMLKALVPLAAPLWYLLSLLGVALLIAVCVVKIIGFALLLLAYVAGPLLLPLAIHPRTAGWVGVWAEHLVKILCWPVVWALEFRVFGALAGGLTFVGPGGTVAGQSLASGAFGALTALATLVLMAYTPWLLHTRFTLRQGAQVVMQQAGRVAGAAAVVATGGAAVSVRGAVAHTIRQRGADRARGGASAAGDHSAS